MCMQEEDRLPSPNFVQNQTQELVTTNQTKWNVNYLKQCKYESDI